MNGEYYINVVLKWQLLDLPVLDPVAPESAPPVCASKYFLSISLTLLNPFLEVMVDLDFLGSTSDEE